MKLVYLNIAWFSFLIFGIVNAALSRYYISSWFDMKELLFIYNLLSGCISLLLVSSITGLLLKRKWGYKLTLASNSVMTLVPLGLLIYSFFLIHSDYSTVELVLMHIGNLFIGFISLFFWAWQTRSGIKVMYVQNNM